MLFPFFYNFDVPLKWFICLEGVMIEQYSSHYPFCSSLMELCHFKISWIIQHELWGYSVPLNNTSLVVEHLGDALLVCVGQVCMSCIRCKSCGVTPGKSWDTEWNHDKGLCPDCTRLNSQGKIIICNIYHFFFFFFKHFIYCDFLPLYRQYILEVIWYKIILQQQLTPHMTNDRHT